MAKSQTRTDKKEPTDSSAERGYNVTPAVRKQRSEAATKHGIYRTRSGIRPADRRKLARYERELVSIAPWIQATDAGSVRSFCFLLVLRDKLLVAISEAGGILNNEGEPRRLVSELRGTLTTLLAYSNALGLTPQARAALGLNVARGRALTLAATLDDEEDDE